MQVTILRHNRFGFNNSTHRQLVAFVVSVIIVLLILMIPVQVYNFSTLQEKTIEVEISKYTPEVKPEIVVPQPKKQMVEPILNPQPIAETTDAMPIDKKPIVVTPKVITTTPTEKQQTEKATKLPSSAVIFESSYGKVHLYELDKDFQKSTGDEYDFKFKVIEKHKIYKVTKLIDEEKDKPRVKMNFYSLGVVGSVERFFDKISYNKKYTTK